MKLSKKEIYLKIKPVIERYQSLSGVYDSLHSVLLCAPDSPFMNEVWQLFDAYETQVAESIGDGGPHSWLAWYIWENKCGENELSASVGKRKPAVIRDPQDLARLIYDSQARS